MAGRNPQTIADVLKDGYTPVLLGRVSSSGQRKGLPAQMEFLRQQARKMGFKKKPVEFAIQQTGRAAELETLRFVQELREANPKKSYVAFFRDSTRIARDLENALALRRQLSDIGIPIIALDLPELTGKKPLGSRSVDVLFGILGTIAESGKNTEQIAQQEGARQAAEVGLPEGVPQTLYLDKLKEVDGKPMSIHRRLFLAIPAIDSGAISIRGLSKTLGFVSKGGKTKGEPNTSQPRKLLGIIRGILAEGGPEKVEEYLEVIDSILAAEKKVGRRDSSRPTRKQKALHAVTVAYLQEPFNWPRPDTEGNPLISETRQGEEAPGTIADAISNPGPYQPKK